jgi:hypothetical protein
MLRMENQKTIDEQLLTIPNKLINSIVDSFQ